MIGIENYIGFLVAGIILNITPGADTIYILTRSISQGHKAGVYSVLGIISGAICHTLLASFGLSAILLKSELLFSIIKWIGAGYLVYMGARMFFSKGSILPNDENRIPQQNLKKIYKQGFLTNLLNPKVAFFYFSFLPQFIVPSEINNPIPFMILGFTFITTGTIWCLFVVYSSAKVSQSLRKNPRLSTILQKVSGVVFVGLGVQLLFSQFK